MPREGGGIPTWRTFVKGGAISVLDVVEVSLWNRDPGTRYQRENRIVRSWTWQIVDRLAPKKIYRYCDDSAPILHTTTDRASPMLLASLPTAEWKSLQLVRVRDAEFMRDSWDRKRWRVSFTDSAGASYSLKVTDPVTCAKLSRGEPVSSDCLLTVSLAEPWAPDSNTAPMCWKLVAAVIELKALL